MDYTKVPRALIYKDRDDLDDFPVIERFDPPQMEARFLDALEQRPFIKESYDAPELILQIFNNARYITTLICLENHPNHYLHRYQAIAGSNNRNITIANHVMPATMALVRNYLCNYFTVYIGSKIVEEITNHFNTDAWKKDTIGGQDDFYKLLVGYSLDNEIVDPSSVHPLWISDEDIKPRDIIEVIDNVDIKDLIDGKEYVSERILLLNKKSRINDILKKAISRINNDLHELYKKWGYDPQIGIFSNINLGFNYNLVRDILEEIEVKKDAIKYFEKFIQIDTQAIGELISSIPATIREKSLPSLPEAILQVEKKNDDINDEKDKLISELRQEVARIKNEFEQYKKKNTEKAASSKATGEEDIKTLKDKVHTLEEDISDMESREGIDAPKAALLVRIACSNLGGLPNNRENAWSLVSNLWGCKESIARRRLKESVKETTVESLAILFDEVSPKIAGIIREEGKKIIEKQKNVK